MRIAVTGACGHVGANLVRRLQARNDRVRAFYHSPASLRALDGVDVDRVQLELLDPASVRAAFADIDVVMHLAAVISINGDPDGRVMRANVVGTRNVAEACLACGVRKLVHFSSIHAFKIPRTDALVDEAYPPADASCFQYDQSKALGEREVLAAVDRGLDATILNPTGILGPCDFAPSRAGQMLSKLFRGGLPILVKGGFDWVDVRDVCLAAARAAESGPKGERYILSGHWVSFDALAQICNEVTGRRMRRRSLDASLLRKAVPAVRLLSRGLGREPLFTEESLDIVDHRGVRYSSAKAARDLGFAARPLRDTIGDTFDWMSANGLA